MEKRTKTQMGTPRQIRFPKDIEADMQTIADQSGLQWVDVVRMAARTGLPILKKRMGESVKQAA